MLRLLRHDRLFELGTTDRVTIPPTPPDTCQKYSYARRRMSILVGVSVIGFTCVTLSTLRLIDENGWLGPLSLLLAYTVVYFVVSQAIYFVSPDFDLARHRDRVAKWRPRCIPNVDIFLPTCGEPLAAIQQSDPGTVTIHCLDDADKDEVRPLAAKFGFHYLTRPNRGWFKTAGNLRYGFERTTADFIAIFDADFRPRGDFLNELLPYFDARTGIIQSPQCFDVRADQNWIERGAGAVRDIFYRAVQVSRQASDGAICVGSNAIYRRAALAEIGGTALIEHCEDVHTSSTCA